MSTQKKKQSLNFTERMLASQQKKEEKLRKLQESLTPNFKPHLTARSKKIQKMVNQDAEKYQIEMNEDL